MAKKARAKGKERKGRGLRLARPLSGREGG